MGILEYKEKAMAFFRDASDYIKSDKKFTDEMDQRLYVVQNFFNEHMPTKRAFVGFSRENKFGYVVFVANGDQQELIINSLMEKNLVSQDSNGYKFLDVEYIIFKQSDRR